MKKTILLSTITAGLLFTTILQAKTDSKILITNQIKNTQKNFKKAPKEIIDALNATSFAIQSLQHNKIDEAKKQFKIATEKFDLALKNNPSLDIVPLDEQFAVSENLASIKTINHLLKESKEFLNQHQFNNVIAILSHLKDEVDIEIVSLPMKIFPIATKDALKALNKGNSKIAMIIMKKAYSTFIIENSVIPLPLLKAQDLINDASNLDKTKKDEATKLLNEAEKELTRATLLGYTNKYSLEYKGLVSSIDNIKKEIKGKNVVEKLYHKLKTDVASLAHKSSAAKKVTRYEDKENIKANKDTEKFNNEAKEDEAKKIK